MITTQITLPDTDSFQGDYIPSAGLTGVSLGSFESKELANSKEREREATAIQSLSEKQQDLYNRSMLEDRDIPHDLVHTSPYLVDKIRKNLPDFFPFFQKWKAVTKSPSALAVISEINYKIDSFWERIPRRDRTVGSTLSLIQDAISNNAWTELTPSQVDAITDVIQFMIQERDGNYYQYAQQKFADAGIRTLPQLRYDPQTEE